jgi:hypothetical protein
MEDTCPCRVTNKGERGCEQCDELWDLPDLIPCSEFPMSLSELIRLNNLPLDDNKENDDDLSVPMPMPIPMPDNKVNDDALPLPDNE